MGAKSIEHIRQNYNICKRWILFMPQSFDLLFCTVGLGRFYTFDLAPKIFVVSKFKYGLEKKKLFFLKRSEFMHLQLILRSSIYISFHLPLILRSSIYISLHLPLILRSSIYISLHFRFLCCFKVYKVKYPVLSYFLWLINKIVFHFV